MGLVYTNKNKMTHMVRLQKGRISLRPTASEYSVMAKKASPPSPVAKNLVMSFLIGGLICGVGEALRQLYIVAGLGKNEAAACVSITFIGITAILTGLNVFDGIAKVAGAGTIVPITGFANSVVSPAMEFKSEGWVLGLGAKMFVIAGPVIVYGTVASTIYGVILCIFHLV